MIGVFHWSQYFPKDRSIDGQPLPLHFSVVVTVEVDAERKSVDALIDDLKSLPGAAYDMNSLEIQDRLWRRKKIRINRLESTVEPGELRFEIERLVKARMLDRQVEVQILRSE